MVGIPIDSNTSDTESFQNLMHKQKSNQPY